MENFSELKKVGNFNIHYPGECNCEINFLIDKGEVVEFTKHNACWEAALLYKSGQQVATNFFNDKIKIWDPELKPESVEKNVWKNFLPLKKNNSKETRRHRHRRKQALVEWILKNNLKPVLKIEDPMQKKYRLMIEKNLENRNIPKEKVEIWADMFLIKN